MGIGTAVLLVHLARQKSLGVCYIAPFASGAVRHRLVKNKYRDSVLKPKDTRKQR